MKVSIKKFAVEMQVKNSGVEFDVYENGENGAHVGDCVVTKTGIIWCEGKTKVQNGKKISWADFRNYMNGL